VLEVNDRGKIEKASAGVRPKVLTKQDNRRGMSMSTSDADSQEGVVVGRVRSAAKIKVEDVTKEHGLARQIENRGLGKPILDKSKIRQVEGITIKTSVSNIDRSAAVSDVSDGEGVVVGKVRRSEKVSTGGIEVKDTSNVRAGSVAAEAFQPRKGAIAIDTKLPPKIRMARRIDPAFPADWSFTGKLAERLAAAKAHGITPQFLEALYAAEGDQFRKLLEKTFPKQFSG
jgi:hypothetical protein